MRARRSIAVGFVAGVLLAAPHEAAADGGAYIQLDRTHYLPGQTAVGETYVYVPEKQADLFDRGPFYVYVVPSGGAVQEGEPIPDGVIRVGTMSFEKYARESYKGHAAFTIPDVPGDYYALAVCNDPCTISGFQEPLSGTISIVQTEREGALLNEYQKLYGTNWGLRNQAKKAARQNAELEASLTDSRETVSELSAEVARLEAELESANAPSPVAVALAAVPPTPVDQDRPLIDAWALVTIGGALIAALVAIVLALVLSRRSSRRFIVPDTIEELDETVEEFARS